MGRREEKRSGLMNEDCNNFTRYYMVFVYGFMKVREKCETLMRKSHLKPPVGCLQSKIAAICFRTEVGSMQNSKSKMTKKGFYQVGNSSLTIRADAERRTNAVVVLPLHYSSLMSPPEVFSLTLTTAYKRDRLPPAGQRWKAFNDEQR